MSTMLRWSPTRQFHFHHDVDDLFLRFGDGGTDEAVQRPASWLPAAGGGSRTARTSSRSPCRAWIRRTSPCPGWTTSSPSRKRKAGPDTADKDYFVREVAYGGFERSFALPEGVDGAQVEAKYANGMLEVRIPAPRAALPRMIEVKGA